MNLAHLWIELLKSLLAISLGNIVLIAIGALLVFLGTRIRPFIYILLPLGFGLILGNFGAFNPSTPLGYLYSLGIGTGIFSLLAVAGLGAVTDFRPLLARPRLILAAAPLLPGVVAALLLAGGMKYPLPSAVSIALTGALNGPAAVYAANTLSPSLVGPVGLAGLLLPLLIIWAASRLSDVPFNELTAASPEPPEEAVRGFPSTQLVFALVIAIGTGFFFRGALPLVMAFLLGNLLRTDPVRSLLPSGLGWLLARAGIMLTSLLVGSALVADAFFTPDALRAVMVALVGLVVCLACFWLLLRRQFTNGALKISNLGGLSALMGAAAAIELVGLLLITIMITVATLIA